MGWNARILPTAPLPASLRRMNAPAILRNSDLGNDAVWQARVDLAACFRMAALTGLHEGVCNHLSFMVPGRDDLFLVNPDGWSFAEITASCLLICDFHRNVIAGDGVPEDTAFYIHARVHMRLPRARAAFHTHMPNATALAMVDGPPLLWAGQSSLKFLGRTVVKAYGGLALDEAEGDRIAAAIGDADIVFMKHHGVMVLAPTVAKAWDDLYYLERACKVQRMAQASGRPLTPIPSAIAERTAARMRQGGSRNSAGLHLESVKRRLDRLAPEYRQ
jgi:ribulose-5-phosphate 4-epimerase/fuculose-1-phosphate aldolase